MDPKDAIRDLEHEWAQPDGFLGRLRTGEFDRQGFERLERILRTVELTDALLDRRFVALTWYIPQFMTWQRERVEEQGGDVGELEVATNMIQAAVEEVLGVP